MISRAMMALLTLIFAMAYIAEAQLVTDGLVAYWTFDEADIDGNMAKDVIGGHDGTILGAPEIIAGEVNEALKFDGVSDYIEAEIPDSLLADGTTLELWFQQEAPTGWGIIIKIDPDKIEVSIGDGVIEVWSDVGRFEPPGLFSDGNWHHVAVPVSDNNIVLYVDGENVGQTAGSLVFEAVSGVTIGRDPGFDFWPGMIDEVRIYDRPLSAEEIQQNMAASGLAVARPTGRLAGTWGKIKI